MSPHKPLVVTAGDPAGIGPELCSTLADSPYAEDVVIVGDKSLIKGSVKVIDTPFPAPVVCGKPDSANAQTLLDGLARAVKGCLNGEFSGLVTLPVAKSVIADAGIPFTGHTELLAELTNAALPVMMLVAGELRVALVSTHIPLSAVPGYVTKKRLGDVIEVLDRELRSNLALRVETVGTEHAVEVRVDILLEIVVAHLHEPGKTGAILIPCWQTTCRWGKPSGNYNRFVRAV